MKKGVKKLKVNWVVLLVLLLALGVTRSCIDCTVEDKQKSDLEQKIEDLINQPPLKLKHSSPTGYILDYGNDTSEKVTTHK